MVPMNLPVTLCRCDNGQKRHSFHSIPGGISLPCLEPLQNGGGTMQLPPLDQPSRRAINNGMTVVSTKGNDISSILPVPEVTMQLDSLDQPSMEATNSEMNFVNAEQTYWRQKYHKSTGGKIDISLEDILRCSNMTRENVASELRVSISTLRRACREIMVSIGRHLTSHDTKNVHPSCRLLVDQESIPELSSDPPSNQTSVSGAHIRPHDPAFQHANMVIIRAKYVHDVTLKFGLSTSSGIVELQKQVAKRHL